MWCLRVCVYRQPKRAGPSSPDTAHWTPCAEPPVLDTLRWTPCVGRPAPDRPAPPKCFFPLLPQTFFLFFSHLGLFSWNCGCDSRPCVDHQKCAFGFPAPFCKTLASCKPLGLATPSGLPPLRGHTMTHTPEWPKWMAKSGWPKNGLDQNGLFHGNMGEE